MTVDAVGTNSPNVFEAGLPLIAYEHAANPEEAHRLIGQARLQRPTRLARTDQKCLATTSFGKFCAITGFACRGGSRLRRKALPAARSGTDPPQAC